ncbi:hypothetical protein [Aeromonas sobria]|uniref:hypothetical protein n=1 Tax=Aeromonas sobria TaxID=646 RepID=UPI003D03BF81
MMNTPDKSAPLTKSDGATASAAKSKEASGASINPTVAHMTQNTHEVVDKLAEAANSTASTFNEKGRDLKEARVTYLKKLRTHINHNPVGSIALAVVIGFFISWLLILIF